MSRSLVPRRPPRVVDVVLAVLMAVFQCVAITGIAWHEGARPLGVLGYGLLVAGSLALAWRTRYPLATLVGTAVLIYAYYGIGYYWLHYALGPAMLVVAFALFTVGTRLSLKTTLIAGVVLAVLVPPLHALVGWLVGQPVDFVLTWIGPAGMFGAAGAIGVAARNWRLANRAARESAAEAERRRAEERRLAIAREVHDVVAHSLATINVQASVAAHVADKRPEQAKEALLAIKDASHTALQDLRATLSVLRTGSLDRAPAPSLARLDELTGRATDLGLTVRVHGSASGLPAPVDAAAYRIIQEAITNTVRHATAASTITIHIGRSADRLTLRISDDGKPKPEPVAGNGLRGMRERVDTLNGTLVAGSGPTGFTVRAEFPMKPDPAAEPADQPVDHPPVSPLTVETESP